jgi:two-component system LytT family response regulator
MTNCIIVDDEPLARQLLQSYIDQTPDLTCLGSYQTAVEAFSALHQHSIDVIFLDIEIPGITGLNFIKSLKVSPKVIFVTAYAEHAVEAFELDAADYLVKPVTFERFFKAVQKINPHKLNNNTSSLVTHDVSYIFLKVDRRLIKIDLSSIVYVESLGDYLKVHTVDQTYITYMTFAKLQALLPGSRFIRIHRSTIVNTACIKFVEGNIVNIGSRELPIGQTYRDELVKKLT